MSLCSCSDHRPHYYRARCDTAGTFSRYGLHFVKPRCLRPDYTTHACGRTKADTIICRLYYVNNPSTNLDASLNIVTSLVQGIETSYQTASQQAPWSLQYRMFRDTIPPRHVTAMDVEGKPLPFAHTLQHHLYLSSLDQNRTYTCIQPPSGTNTVSAIPLNQQEPYALLLRHQFSSLWQPRHVLSLQQGTSYTAGLCTIQVGELRSIKEGPQSAGIQSPGVLVCISTVIGEDESEDSEGSANSVPSDEEEPLDLEYAQALIRDCWGQIKSNRDLGKSEVKEVMMALDSSKSREKDMAVRMWCEVLRLRG
jgi:hypothetical protein